MQAINGLFFLIMFMGIAYFMLVRPQKRRIEQHKQLMDSIGIGDEIVTIGGLHGTIKAIGEEDFEIEAAPGVTLTFVKNAVARRITEELHEGDEASTAGDTEATAEDAGEPEVEVEGESTETPALASGEEEKS